MADLELDNVRVFDVLKCSLNGELGVVLSISGDRLDMRDKTGAVARYKFGKHFSRVSQEEAVDFRELVREARKLRQEAEGKKKRRPRTASAFLNKLKKKR